MKSLSQMSAGARAARIAQLIKNPGTRAAIPDQYLPPKLRAERQRLTTARQPVVPGSTLTNQGLAQQRQAATDLQFGPNAIGRSQQMERDTGGWYDDYLKELATHRGNVDQIGKDAVAGIERLAGTQQAAPETTGMSAENMSDADRAAAVRKALVASFGAVENARGTNATTYADTLAHVVAPGQKLTGLAQARGATNSLRDQIAAFGTKYTGEVMTAEQQAAADRAKTALAEQALGLDVSKAVDSSAAGRATRREDRRHNKAQESAAAAKERAKANEVNQYGVTNADWAAMSTAERQQTIKDFKNSGKTGKPNGGHGWGTPEQQGGAQGEIGRAQNYINSLIQQNPALKNNRQAAAKYLLTSTPAQPVFQTVKDATTGKTKQVRVLNPDGTQKTTAGWKAADPLFASVALDMAIDGHISKNNVKRLHARGIRIDSLGLPTHATRPTGAGAYTDNKPAGGGH